MKRRMMLVATIWAALAPAVYAQPGNTPVRGTAAQDDESDGPEANAMLPIDVDQLIAVAVTQSPDLAKAKIDRLAAKYDAHASRRALEWILLSNLRWA